MTPMYDRSVIQEALADMPDQFESQDWVKWFERRYGDIDENSVRNYLRRECVNCPQGRGRAARHRGETKVYRPRRGHFEKYLPEQHGEFAS